MDKQNTVLTVDLGAIRHNINVLQSYLAPDTLTMAVVKANAYGHGIIKVARAICSQVDWLAVNDIQEGVRLRKSGLNNPILVFSIPELSTARFYTEYNLTATIGAADQFAILPPGTQYHLNFNTGMTRLGFRLEEIENIQQLKEKYVDLRCTGLYSHFATADANNVSKTNEQFRAFKKVRSRFDSTLISHMCNTAGIVQCGDAHFDMVRFGIGMYGYAPGEISIPQLKPAAQWQTQLVQVNAIKERETVSYGANWQAPQDGFIGVIPLGYSDGIPRLLSGKMKVSIGGEVYPVIGTITMNYCMIDLGKRAFEPSTKVQLWDQQYTAKDWADALGTIPYEMLTGVRSHIPRRYRS